MYCLSLKLARKFNRFGRKKQDDFQCSYRKSKKTAQACYRQQKKRTEARLSCSNYTLNQFTITRLAAPVALFLKM